MQTQSTPARAGRYAGLVVGVTQRVSTGRQDQNRSSRYQQEDLPAWLEREGATVKLYAEGAVSGRLMEKRPVALDLIADLRGGTLDAWAAADVERLTRDSSMRDAGDIVRLCAERCALIITYDRDYDVGDREDRHAFLAAAQAAGYDVDKRRDVTWRRGVLPTVQDGPMPFGIPSFGYKCEPRERPATDRGRRRIDKVLVKDPACTDAMHALAELLDRCETPGEVVAQLNAAGIRRPVARGRFRGLPRPWLWSDVRHILESDRYAGTWTFGCRSDFKSPVWRDPRAGTAQQAPIRHERPDLAWWEPARFNAWRSKFQVGVSDGRPRKRHRTHDRPLRGVLCCVTCGEPLRSAGRMGYRCGVRDCERPQIIDHALALAVVRELAADVAMSAVDQWGPRQQEIADRITAAEGRQREVQLINEGLVDALVDLRSRGLSPQAVLDRIASTETEIQAAGRLLADLARESADLAAAMKWAYETMWRDALGEYGPDPTGAPPPPRGEADRDAQVEEQVVGVLERLGLRPDAGVDLVADAGVEAWDALSDLEQVVVLHQMAAAAAADGRLPASITGGWEALSEAEQVALVRHFVADVQIEGVGWASHRRHAVKRYRNLVTGKVETLPR